MKISSRPRRPFCWQKRRRPVKPHPPSLILYIGHVGQCLMFQVGHSPKMVNSRRSSVVLLEETRERDLILRGPVGRGCPDKTDHIYAIPKRNQELLQITLTIRCDQLACQQSKMLPKVANMTLVPNRRDTIQ